MTKTKMFIFAFILLCNSLQATTPSVKEDTLSKEDRMAIALTEIWSLDQGIRNDVQMYFSLDKAFLLKIDSLLFDKSMDFIKTYGWVYDFGKYNKDYDHLRQALGAVMLHSPHRLVEPSVYQVLKKEAVEGRLNKIALALFLDKYYVIYEKRTLYNSDFKQWLTTPFPFKGDKTLSDSLMLEIGLKPLPDSIFVDKIDSLRSSSSATPIAVEVENN